MQTDSTIHERLQSCHRHWRRQVLWRGVARSVVVLLVLLVVACLLDHIANFAFRSRLLMALMIYVLVVGFTWVDWGGRLLRKFSPEDTAWLLEKRFKEFDGSLISSVQLWEAPSPHGSVELRDELLRQVREDVACLEPAATFRCQWRHVRLATVLSGLFLLLFLVPGLHWPLRIGRVMKPGGSQASLGGFTITLDISPGMSLAEGDTWRVTATVSNPQVRALFLQVDDGRPRQRRMDAAAGVPGRFSSELPEVRQSFTVRAVAGDVESRLHRITVARRPDISLFRLRYVYPEYTGLPPLMIERSTGDVKALVGTQVTIEAISTDPLAAAVLGLGDSAAPIPGALSEDGRQASFSFRVGAAGSYSIRVQGRNGLYNRRDLSYRIMSVPDEPPTVSLQSPAVARNFAPDAVVDLEWMLTDDYPGVRQEIVVRLDDGRPAFRLAPSAELRSYRLPLVGLGLAEGDMIDFFITARDAAGHLVESERRLCLIGGGERLLLAHLYVERLNTLRAVLGRARGHLADLLRFSSVLDSLQSEWAHNRDHYLRMAETRAGHLRDSLATAQALAGEVRRAGFFPNSIVAAETVRESLEQQRIFQIPEIEHQDAGTALQQLDRQMQMLLELCDILYRQARAAQADIELPLLGLKLQNSEAGLSRAVLWPRLQAVSKAAIDLDLEEAVELKNLLAALSADAGGSVDAHLTTRAAILFKHLTARNREVLEQREKLTAAIDATERELQPWSARLQALLVRSPRRGTMQRGAVLSRLALGLRRSAELEVETMRKADLELLAIALRTDPGRKQVSLEMLGSEVVTALRRNEALQQLHHAVRKATKACQLAFDAATDSAVELHGQPFADFRLSLPGAVAAAEITKRRLGDQWISDVADRLAAISATWRQALSTLAASPPSGVLTAIMPAIHSELRDILDMIEAELKVQNRQAALARLHLRLLAPPLADEMRAVHAELKQTNEALAADTTSRHAGKIVLDRSRNTLFAVGDSLVSEVARSLLVPHTKFSLTNGITAPVVLAALVYEVASDDLSRGLTSLSTAAELSSSQAGTGGRAREVQAHASGSLAQGIKKLELLLPWLEAYEKQQLGTLALDAEREIRVGGQKSAEPLLPRFMLPQLRLLAALREIAPDVALVSRLESDSRHDAARLEQALDRVWQRLALVLIIDDAPELYQDDVEVYDVLKAAAWRMLELRATHRAAATDALAAQMFSAARLLQPLLIEARVINWELDDRRATHELAVDEACRVVAEITDATVQEKYVADLLRLRGQFAQLEVARQAEVLGQLEQWLRPESIFLPERVSKLQRQLVMHLELEPARQYLRSRLETLTAEMIAVVENVVPDGEDSAELPDGAAATAARQYLQRVRDYLVLGQFDLAAEVMIIFYDNMAKALKGHDGSPLQALPVGLLERWQPSRDERIEAFFQQARAALVISENDSGEEVKGALEMAREAFQNGQYEKMREMLQALVEPHIAEYRTVRLLENLARRRSETVAPVEAALNAALGYDFDKALACLRSLPMPDAAPAQTDLQKARDAVREVGVGAIKDALKAPELTLPERHALVRSARNLMHGNTDEAYVLAKEAGGAAMKMTEALQRVELMAGRAQQSVSETLVRVYDDWNKEVRQAESEVNLGDTLSRLDVAAVRRAFRDGKPAPALEPVRRRPPWWLATADILRLDMTWAERRPATTTTGVVASADEAERMPPLNPLAEAMVDIYKIAERQVGPADLPTLIRATEKIQRTSMLLQENLVRTLRGWSNQRKRGAGFAAPSVARAEDILTSGGPASVNWELPVPGLTALEPRQLRPEYNAYYREAIRQYLEKLANDRPGGGNHETHETHEKGRDN